MISAWALVSLALKLERECKASAEQTEADSCDAGLGFVFGNAFWYE